VRESVRPCTCSGISAVHSHVSATMHAFISWLGVACALARAPCTQEIELMSKPASASKPKHPVPISITVSACDACFSSALQRV
jgi:hypothetical protein